MCGILPSDAFSNSEHLLYSTTPDLEEVSESITMVCVCLWGLNACKGVHECLGLGSWSKCSILEKLQKAKFHTHDTFETSKFQNRCIKAPWKSFGYWTFWILWVRQKKNTCDSLFGSPCSMIFCFYARLRFLRFFCFFSVNSPVVQEHWAGFQ